MKRVPTARQAVQGIDIKRDRPQVLLFHTFSTFFIVSYIYSNGFRSSFAHIINFQRRGKSNKQVTISYDKLRTMPEQERKTQIATLEKMFLHFKKDY